MIQVINRSKEKYFDPSQLIIELSREGVISSPPAEQGPSEYFCNDCGHYGVSANFKPDQCYVCKKENITVGKIGELDQDALRSNFISSKKTTLYFFNTKV